MKGDAIGQDTACSGDGYASRQLAANTLDGFEAET